MAAGSFDMAEATPAENLKNGDKQAISRIVEQHTAVLLRGALGQGWSPNDAEDLVQ
ncbi:MAG: RNA polymerase sigma-70 factor, partial [Elusimicrobia bacterium CG_4_9_14_3_um_filter_62_55]